MGSTPSTSWTASLPLLTGLCLLLTGCSDDSGPTAPEGPGEPEPATVSGHVTSTDDRGGVEAARIRLVGDADTVLEETYTDASGAFAFRDVSPGSFEVRATLPQGYRESGPTSRAVDVEGDTEVSFQGEPILRDTVTVAPGGRDTLSTASGTFVAVDAEGAGADLSVTLEEVSRDRFAGEDVKAAPVRFRVRPEGAGPASGSAPAARLADAAATDGGAGVTVQVGQRFAGSPTNTSFVFDVGEADRPLRLYADATSTTYRDPETGREETVPLHTFDAPADADVEALMAAASAGDDCSGEEGLRTLEPLPGDDTGDKALILVHGLQPFKDDCGEFRDFDPVSSTFDPLIAKLRSSAEIDDAYRFYVYRYPTNAPVLASSDSLWARMQERGIERPVILAHSMGGLVGRGLMNDHGNDAVAGLVTLGTPHAGSPVAEVALGLDAVEDVIAAIECNSSVPARLICSSGVLDGGLFPDTEGLRDLLPDSDLVTALTAAQADSRKVFTLGGRLSSVDAVEVHGDGRFVVYWGGRVYMELRGQDTDGMVPVSSATPEWTALQTVLEDHDHTEMVQGEEGDEIVSGSVRSQLLPVLGTLATCEPPPEKPETNDFELSGSVAREGDRTVGVTLNAITVDGSVVTDLTSDDFLVVENGCVRDITDFSTENVGIDLVFAQDMSGSMGTAISGVRSSVTSFAADLASRGVNVRIGSAGYSGPGTIASTPGPSPCEFLGPFRDLTDPTSFQDHVSNQWTATNGCDLPENALEAIEYADDQISWRPGAARVYVDITDASHHTASTNCNGVGACTDQTVGSLVDLVGGTSTIHAVAPGSESARTSSGGADPWELADGTGGTTLVLPSDGSVDLTSIGISEVVGEAVRFRFESASPREAVHTLRIRAEIDGQVAELAPDLVSYLRMAPSLTR